MRTCKKCLESKSLEDFSADKKRIDGLRIYCKPCSSEIMRDNRAKRKKMSGVIPESKLCAGCSEVKSSDMFQRDPGAGTGLMSYCKRCNRSMALMRKFGIDSDTYDTMLVEQNGVCAICKRSCVSGRSLAVDHCHSTGRVRGLLCCNCNRALGLLEDNIEFMGSMLDYMKDTLEEN